MPGKEGAQWKKNFWNKNQRKGGRGILMGGISDENRSEELHAVEARNKGVLRKQQQKNRNSRKNLKNRNTIDCKTT